MSRNIAVGILNAASHAVGTVRGQQHGAIHESFDMIGDMWSVYINNAIHRATGLRPNPPIQLTGLDVLRMQGQLKQARALWGDHTNPDHYIDEAGYSSLAAAYIGAAASTASVAKEYPPEPASDPDPEPEPDLEYKPDFPPASPVDPVDPVKLGDNVGANTPEQEELMAAIRSATDTSWGV